MGTPSAGSLFIHSLCAIQHNSQLPLCSQNKVVQYYHEAQGLRSSATYPSGILIMACFLYSVALTTAAPPRASQSLQIVKDFAIKCKPAGPKLTVLITSCYTPGRCPLITPGPRPKPSGTVRIPQSLLTLYTPAHPKPAPPASAILSHENHNKGSCTHFLFSEPIKFTGLNCPILWFQLYLELCKHPHYLLPEHFLYPQHPLLHKDTTISGHSLLHHSPAPGNHSPTSLP